MLRQEEVRIIGIDSSPDVVQRHLVDAFHRVPPLDDPNFIEEVASICYREEVDVILPQHDRDALILSHHATKLLPSIVAAASEGVIERVWDKGHLLYTCQELGLTTPPFEVASSPQAIKEAAKSLGYPDQELVIKPTRQWGTRGLHILSERKVDAKALFSERSGSQPIALSRLCSILEESPRCPSLLLMPYLPGPEYSVDAFIGEKAAVAIPRLRLSILGGGAIDTQLHFRQDLIDQTLQIARHSGLKYAFGMQYKLDPSGVPQILECNPRIQGASIASLFSGANIALMAVHEALQNPPEQPQIKNRPARFARHWGGLAYGADWTQEV